MNSRLSCLRVRKSVCLLTEEASAISICSSAVGPSATAGRLAIATADDFVLLLGNTLLTWKAIPCLGTGQASPVSKAFQLLHLCSGSGSGSAWYIRPLRFRCAVMSPHRITATSAFWPAPSPASEDWAITARDTPGGFRARPLPISTSIPLDSLGGSPAEHVSVWLRKHGRVSLLCCEFSLNLLETGSPLCQPVAACRPSSQN